MYDSLLGRTYAEIGSDARSNHKCQGTNGLPALPGIREWPRRRWWRRAYQLMETSIPGEIGKDETSLFDGDRYQSDARLRRMRARIRRMELKPGSRRSPMRRGGRRRRSMRVMMRRYGAPVEAGLTAVRALRARLGSLGLSDAARYEIDFRLKIKERDYEDAVIAAHGLSFDAVSDDGLVIEGQPVKLSIARGESRRVASRE